jgi:hypothetical protein
MSKNIPSLIQRLKANLHQRVSLVDPELLIAVMERYTFIHFQRAMNYFYNAKKMFQNLRPELAILSADTYENFILAAQAAKQVGVKTAIIPHGLYCWGYSDYHKALILSPDNMNICPAYKFGEEMVFYHEVSRLLEELGIELIGIKARHEMEFSNSGIETNELNLNGKKIPLLFGYTAFPEAVKEADIIIGPASTVIIEASLLSKDYYVYQQTPFHDFTLSILPALYDCVNVSYNMLQLRKNILNKQPYRQGCSVYDIVDLEGVKTREDLFRKFESGVEEVLALAGKDASAIKEPTALC